MWRHPKYYKDLRKLARLRNRDQAISDNDSTESRERAPGTGLKQQASSSKPQATSYKLPGPRPISNANKGLIHRPQASSAKRQASQPE